jgi:AcrR family transcriptional regulator
MNRVEVPVSQITSPGGDLASAGLEAPGRRQRKNGEARGAGRRQRKKQHTRDALIQAALELFLAKGYDRTAVREITDVVDVSERTFFRYFASKEDLVLSFVRDGAVGFARALADRPAQEEPLTAARNAYHISLRRLPGSTDGEVAPYLSVMQLVDSTPALLAAFMRYTQDQDDEVVRILAEREGVDPATDRRPRLLAAMIGMLVYLANRDWRAGMDQSPEAMAAAFDAYADELTPALTGHWSGPR